MATYREYFFKLRLEQFAHAFNDRVIYAVLMDVSNYSFFDLTKNFDEEVKNEEKLNDIINEILTGKPYEYVLGKCLFHGHDYYVNENVLIPRPETEELVDIVIKKINNLNANHKLNVLDMCSGSGVIGIEIKLNTTANVDLVDISSDANEVAIRNAELHKTNVGIYESDLFSNLPTKKYDVIVSNPPYIKGEERVDSKVLKYEPHLALFASPQTKFYEEIFKAKDNYFMDQTLLAFEIDDDMVNELDELVHKYFDNDVNYEFVKDIYGLTRYLFINYDKHGK